MQTRRTPRDEEIFENAAAQEASHDQAVGRQRGRGKKEEGPFFAFRKARASPTHRMCIGSSKLPPRQRSRKSELNPKE